jgi:hypothetical protein
MQDMDTCVITPTNKGVGYLADIPGVSWSGTGPDDGNPAIKKPMYTSMIDLWGVTWQVKIDVN